MPVVRLYYQDMERLIGASRETIMSRLAMMGAGGGGGVWGAWLWAFTAGSVGSVCPTATVALEARWIWRSGAITSEVRRRQPGRGPSTPL